MLVKWVNLLYVSLQAPLNNKINKFSKLYRICRNSHHWAFSCADPCQHQRFNNKISLGGLINGTQVNIFLVSSLTTDYLKYLRNVWITCTLDCFCQVFLSLVSHRSWTMGHSRLGHLCCWRKVRAHALAIRCTDDKPGIVLEVKKLNVISLFGEKNIFLKKQLFALF